MKYKLAVVGVEGGTAMYRMLGIETFIVADNAGAKDAVERIMNETQPGTEAPAYAVVFIEEDLHEALPTELIEKLTKRALPALIPVPTPASEKGKKSYGVRRLYTLVERAIGSNILG